MINPESNTPVAKNLRLQAVGLGTAVAAVLCMTIFGYLDSHLAILDAGAPRNPKRWSEIVDIMLGEGLLLTVGLALSGMIVFWATMVHPLNRLSRVAMALAHGQQVTIPRLRFAAGGAVRLRDALSTLRQSVAEREKIEERERLAEIDRYDRWAEQHFVVASLAEGLGRLAEGNLTRSLDTCFPKDFESLRQNFNGSTATLDNLIGAVVRNGAEIRLRTDQISSLSDDLSRRTERQAATLEQTAAALDEMTASVRSAADGAAQVESVVSGARSDAEQSSEVMKQAVSAMSEITGLAQGIFRIIDVIDDIAFQTNLLALNAGVEAARAGEAGRGFAVVASEVRALSQRSSEAAREIKQLIGTSSIQVEVGVDLVNRAGRALTDIVARVGQIADLVSGITRSAREQSVGLDEINAGVTHLDQATQQNAGMARETTEAVAALKQEAQHLNELTGRFRLKEVQVLNRTCVPEPSPAAQDAVTGMWDGLLNTGT
ncbi:methyl-accepting chemotaxis protein [Rhodobacter sp. Har01]|uniref:methyl-accepting chemotaxis protein n=1 Tax=Rhodobacter sp. Har01 TaxID=2883999 RepID=UPI001D098144|nr:methyl-accepting chemotaxis protein [Rhodobacter sp. Har01]MCB6180197.1 methyl-accepting chemotaxis protein [Rhodobacter sp. Har01]